MIDKQGRNIEYLRISLTDVCNLRCVYCMPKDNITFMDKEKILKDDEVIKLVKLMAKCGIKKVRLTGGEPLTRKNILKIIEDIHRIPGIEEIYITTNALLLEGKEREFKEAGLKGVNISLDTLKEENYRDITRGGDLKVVLRVIDNLLDLGIKVKVNSVIIGGVNEDEILNLAALTINKKMDVRFIELMPIGAAKDLTPITNNKVKELIKQGHVLEDEKVIGISGPAKYVQLKNALGKVGFISAISDNFCESCNRIRVTSEGFLKQCLHWNYGIDLKTLIRNGMNDEQLLEIIRDKIYNKPIKHSFGKEEKDKDNRFMNEIGG
ncbi:GTP 3',8-cyclase MoaA [Clostridium sp. UBA1652]|uniref:GTP 3',8-cyclase MoaA n=1 Tax=Clostridium sp. UBA1652 TaxID=1946348 RepID=UPI00257E3269|nr:GTP 3',8-cyclase MoaA [Clostridium sp. UBA1652]